MANKKQCILDASNSLKDAVRADSIDNVSMSFHKVSQDPERKYLLAILLMGQIMLWNMSRLKQKIKYVAMQWQKLFEPEEIQISTKLFYRIMNDLGSLMPSWQMLASILVVIKMSFSTCMRCLRWGSVCYHNVPSR